MDYNQLIDKKISMEGKIADLRQVAGESTLTSEQAAEFNQLKEEYEALLVQIDNVKATDAAKAFNNKPVVKPEVPQVFNQKDDFNMDAKKGYQHRGDLAADVIKSVKTGQCSDRLNSYIKSTNTLKVGLDANGDILQANGAASTLVDGVEIIPDLITDVKEYGQGSGVREILDMFSPLSTDRKQVDYYINDDTYNVDGLVTQRIAEGGTLTAQNFNNKRKSFRLNKVAIFAQITEEDIQNVPLLESRYMRRAPQTLEVQKVQDIIAGTGVDQCIGFTSTQNTAAVTVTRAGNGSIAYSDIRNIEGRAKRGNAGGQWFYIVNENSLSQLMSIKDDRGALLWRANTNLGAIQEIMPGYLNGKPVIVSEDCPLLTEEGCLTYQNTFGYIFGQHTSDVRYAESMHFFFDKDMHALRWISQYGGQPVFTSAYTPRRSGAATLSHTVKLSATT